MQYWGKTIRQVRGLGRAKKVAQDVELNANANDDPVLNDPAVRDQLRAQGKVDYKVHLCLELGAQPFELCLTLSLYSSIFSKPLFLLAVTLAQLGMMAAELVVNQGFEPPAQNVLFVNICSTPPKTTTTKQRSFLCCWCRDRVSSPCLSWVQSTHLA